jgi:group I intron endonuclease
MLQIPFTIYKITNLINGKIYIGRTIQKLKKRFSSHIRESHKEAPKYIISKSIKKYGKENFICESIDERATDIFQLIKLETKYIKQFNSLVPNGYNCILDDNNTRILSKRTLKKRKEQWKNLTTKEKLNYSQKQSKILQGLKREKQKNAFSKFVGIAKGRVNKITTNYVCKPTFMGKTYYNHFKYEKSAAVAYDLINLHFRGFDGTILNFPQYIPSYQKINLKKYFEWFVNKKRNLQKNKSSKFMGVGIVAKNKKQPKWRMRFYPEKITKYFKNEIDAAKYYDMLVMKYNLNKKLNFPQLESI